MISVTNGVVRHQASWLIDVLQIGTSVDDVNPASVDRRGRESPRGSGRRGSPRGAAPRARSAAPTSADRRLLRTGARRRCGQRALEPPAASHERHRACGASPSRVAHEPAPSPHQRPARRPALSADASAAASRRAPVAERRSRLEPRRRARLLHRRRGARAEDQPLEQRVARQPVRAVHAGAGDLAGGEQPGQRCAARRGRCRRRPSCSARPGRPESRSRARSRPAARHTSRRSSETARARSPASRCASDR